MVVRSVGVKSLTGLVVQDQMNSWWFGLIGLSDDPVGLLRVEDVVLPVHMAWGLPVGEVRDRVTWVGAEPQVSERDADPGGVCVSVCVSLLQMSQGSVNVLHSSRK